MVLNPFKSKEIGGLFHRLSPRLICLPNPVNNVDRVKQQLLTQEYDGPLLLVRFSYTTTPVTNWSPQKTWKWKWCL